MLVDGAQSVPNRYCALVVPWITLTATSDLQASGTTSTYIDYRHNKAFHGLYADGHVGTITRTAALATVTKQVWTGRTN